MKTLFPIGSDKYSISNAFYWEMKRNPHKYPTLRKDGNILLSTQKNIEAWAEKFSSENPEYYYYDILEAAEKTYYKEKRNRKGTLLPI